MTLEVEGHMVVLMSRIDELRAAAETAPRGGRGARFSEGFSDALHVAKQVRPAAASEDGIKWVACRRCGGTGVYQMQSGPGECSGHARAGYCRNGRSLGPADRAVMAVRKAEATLAAYRAAWVATAALVPVTRADHTTLARELGHLKTHGTFAARSLATAQAG